MEYQLELIDVAKQYKDFLAVDRVNMQIKKGEIVSFLGASGCGKTTTLRMIAGLIEPTRGMIKIEGRAMNGIPPYKRDISMVFQNYALFPHLSVYENIVYGLKTRKIKDKKVLMKKAREMMDDDGSCPAPRSGKSSSQRVVRRTAAEGFAGKSNDREP